MSKDPLSVYFQTAVNLGDSKAGNATQEASKTPSQLATSSTAKSMSNPVTSSSKPLHSFVIGKFAVTEPLVEMRTVEGHLQLLHAFSQLGSRIVGFPGPNYPRHLGGWRDDDKWRYFLGLAVERFDLWCGKLDESDLDIAWDVFLPPLDVLMVWHSYLLNPLWYAEDAQRVPRCKVLAQLGCHLISALQSDCLPAILRTVSEERKSFWVGRTSLDFVPEACLQTYLKKSAKNLCCGQVDEIDFCNESVTNPGYLQKHFSHLCSNRSAHGPAVLSSRSSVDVPMTRGLYAVQRLACDLKKATSTAEGHLRGSYLATSNPLSVRQEGLQIKSKLISHIEADERIGEIDGSERFLWEMSRSYAMADIKKVIGGSPLALRIMNAYSDDKPYSVGLIDAVLRQEKFVRKMKELKWSVPDHLEKSDVQILPHAVARYHAFLDLMATHPGTMLVPTLDIDLVWHTHQLMYSKYGDDCVKYVGRFIDHDDKVEGTQLSNSFDQTSLLWKSRFKVPYTCCGCPNPSPKFKERLSTLLDRKNSQSPYSPLVTPPVLQADVTLATHPSEHNAVQRRSPPGRYSSAYDTTYSTISLKNDLMLNKHRSRLYKSPAYHPYEKYGTHPYHYTFLRPFPLIVDSSGLEAGTQCAGGSADKYPSGRITSAGGGGGAGGGGTSGGIDASCGGGGCGGSACYGD